MGKKSRKGRHTRRRKIDRIVGGALETAFKTAGRILVLPVDFAFFLYDIWAVNLKKAGLFRYDCQGKTGHHCPVAEKYTNKWLFHLLCRDVRSSSKAQKELCTAGSHKKIYTFRALLVLLAFLLVSGGILGGAIFFWPQGRSTTPKSAEARRQLSDQQVALAGEAFQAENYARAAELYEKALRLTPERNAISYDLARSLEKKGDSQRALHHYRRAALKAKGAAASRSAEIIAVSLYEKGRLQPAGHVARRGLKAGEPTGLLHAIVADICLAEGKVEKAAQHVGKARELDPAEPIVKTAHARLLLARDQIEKASVILDEVETDHGLPTWRLAKAQILWQANQPQKASELVGSLLKDFPESHTLRILQVEVLFAAGEPEKALSAAKDLRENYPLSSELRIQLARVLDRYGASGHALQIALDLTGSAEQPAGTHALIGKIFLQKGLLVPATTHAERALEKTPDSLEAVMLNGKVAMLRSEHDRARELFGKATELEPENAATHHLLGVAHMGADSPDDAISGLQKASELLPENGRFHYDLARALSKAGRTEDARHRFELAAQYLDNPYKAYTWLGTLAQQNQDLQQATVFYEKAIQADPRRAAIAANNLAEALMNQRKNLPLALALAYNAHVMAPPQFKDECADTMAKALIATGGAARAVPAARMASAAVPDNPGRLLRLGIAEGAAGNRKNATRALRKVVETADNKEMVDLARQLTEAINSPQKQTQQIGEDARIQNTPTPVTPGE